jgi:hypothetical protein
MLFTATLMIKSNGLSDCISLKKNYLRRENTQEYIRAGFNSMFEEIGLCAHEAKR